MKNAKPISPVPPPPPPHALAPDSNRCGRLDAPNVIRPFSSYPLVTQLIAAPAPLAPNPSSLNSSIGKTLGDHSPDASYVDSSLRALHPMDPPPLVTPHNWRRPRRPKVPLRCLPMNPALSSQRQRMHALQRHNKYSLPISTRCSAGASCSLTSLEFTLRARRRAACPSHPPCAYCIRHPRRMRAGSGADAPPLSPTSKGITLAPSAGPSNAQVLLGAVCARYQERATICMRASGAGIRGSGVFALGHACGWNEGGARWLLWARALTHSPRGAEEAHLC